MALFRIRPEMYFPYFLSYICSVAANTYITHYRLYMTEKETASIYCMWPMFMLVPYFIRTSIHSPYSDKQQYHCWMYWDNARFSCWDLVAFAFHIFFISISMIEPFYTQCASVFVFIYILIRGVVCFIVSRIHESKIERTLKKMRTELREKQETV